MRMHYLPLSSKMLRRVIASSKKLGFCFTSRSFATLPRDDLQKIVLDVANNFSSVPVTVDSKFDDFKPRDASPRPWDALDTVEMLLIVCFSFVNTSLFLGGGSC